MKTIVLSADEKDCLKDYVDRNIDADTGFSHAVRFCRQTETALWDKIREMYPSATNLQHPKEGDWTINCPGEPDDGK